VTDASVPQHVRSLITSHIQTLEHLEVLMLLFQDADRWWSAQSVGEELGISSGAAGALLEDLSSRTLLDARVAETVVFRYRPVTDVLKSSVDDLASLYAEKPSETIRLVSAIAADPIRGLADASNTGPRKSRG
jgi:hypothetical protein